ncbi:unnamed protein product [Lupinus luteus]|uniref:Uncharacterized protein n=1 Tax=Lupinus luteus TaxID=3873 RepID=A0AAV1WGG0_LUPLU
MTYNNMMRMIAAKRYYGEESDLKDIDEAKEFRETAMLFAGTDSSSASGHFVTY